MYNIITTLSPIPNGAQRVLCIGMAERARFCGVRRRVAEFVPSLLVWYVLSGAINILCTSYLPMIRKFRSYREIIGL